MSDDLQADLRRLRERNDVADLEIVGEQILVTTACAQRAFPGYAEAVAWLDEGTECGPDLAKEHLVGMALCPCMACIPNIWNPKGSGNGR